MGEEHCVFILDAEELQYRFRDDHPFNQERLKWTRHLLKQLKALPDSCIRPAPAATDEELLLVHRPDYLDAVKQLSLQPDDPKGLAGRYGFDWDDTPCFPGMHAAASRIVGGTLQAVRLVMEGQAAHALHLGGGLHHAFPGKAAGFCIYNDAAIAIAEAKTVYGARVLYVDTDVHHGDGVQWAFYTDPDVCTLSIHETGKYLYPGTGYVHERGEGDAYGTCLNLPLEPYTEDESWLDCFRQALEAAAATFRPDLIVSQHGCDAHAFDPLSHMHCSMNIYYAMPQLLHEAAHRWCEGRWVALGGGGYDIWRVVPRAWSLLWLVMTGHPLIGKLAVNPKLKLPREWVEACLLHSGIKDPLPTTWLDPVEQWAPILRRREIEARNRQTLELALQVWS